MHRDVKPSNVFVGRDGRVRIGDFGIARDHAGEAVGAPVELLAGVGRLTVTGAVVGTPGYMAPEQLRGAVDARSDQFALCVAIVEGLTGARPEVGAAPPLPGLPGALRDVLIRGLAVDPGARFATMAELANALAGAIAPPAPTAAPHRWRISIPVAIAAAAITAGVVAAVVARPDSQRAAAAIEGSAPKQEAIPKVVLPSTDGTVAQSAPADPPHRVPDATAARAEVGSSGERGAVQLRPDAVASAEPIHGSRSTSKPAVRPWISEQGPSVEDVPKLVKQAREFERSAKWDEAREVWQRLESIKDHRSEALYREAWAAFQANDLYGAAQLALQVALEPGRYQLAAKFLYGDALFRLGDYGHARERYLELRGTVQGEERATTTKKIAACNKALGLPEQDGIHDN